jgi:hypothetical protein
VNDDEFLRALEDCTLAEPDFGHAAHVRAGYLYLQRYGFPGALARIRRTIQDFAAHHGRPDRYSETMTVAYLTRIHQHLCERGDGGGWAEFAHHNPELFDRGAAPIPA